MSPSLPRAVPRKGDFLLLGHAATIVGIALVWFAIWTVACNALVLSGFHYPAFLWALLATTILASIIASCFYARIARIYTSDFFETEPQLARPFSPRLAAALAIAAIIAFWTQRTNSPVPYVGGTTLIALLMWRSEQTERLLRGPSAMGAVGGRLSLLILVLLAIYYFSHRADADDAKYINLAIGAQRTTGGVFQFDTMLGDGPGAIHLPTYKFHSFELLGAVISSVTGLEPITV